MKKIEGNLVDIHLREIYPAIIEIKDNKIVNISKSSQTYNRWIVPGFIDSHIHIESSMLTPVEFGNIAVKHGTIATVSDPHEIANVVGLKGVEFMIENGKRSLVKHFFGAPSCVPATSFETAGDVLNSSDVEMLLGMNEIKYLSEMMNFPGVIYNDPEVMAKIQIAHRLNKSIDGHAPGLRGDGLKKYVSAGIYTDHECFSLEEALEKIDLGMKILIREGSAARNFEALKSLLTTHPSNCMLCSDDKHPDDLIEGHINLLIKRALSNGSDLFEMLRCASMNPANHYGLEVGLLRQGDLADFVVIDHPEKFNVLETWINGVCVYSNSKVSKVEFKSELPNKFIFTLPHIDAYKLPLTTGKKRVIQIVDGEIITREHHYKLDRNVANFQHDESEDVMKILVVSRYGNQNIGKSLVRGFGFKMGAIASTVAHDSHNILVAGTSDEWIAEAIELITENKGGIAFVNDEQSLILPLPIAGLMTDKDVFHAANLYKKLSFAVLSAGCSLRAPFMSLSFLALPVIPKLKLTDKGLFDVDLFDFVPIAKEE